jgi:tetratricopeptide (TPR) repeat protein
MEHRNLPVQAAFCGRDQGLGGGLRLAHASATFHEMMESLSRSKLPLSIRNDVETVPSDEDVQTARAVISHVMTDSDVRVRLPSLKVEPLVRAAAILLADSRRTGRAPKEVAQGLLEYLDVIAGAFGAVPSILNNRGLARMAVGDTHRAMADFDAARRLAPAFIAPRVNELDLYRMGNDFERLERAAEDILRIDPKNTGALRARLDARTGSRRPNEAVREAAADLHQAGGASLGDLLLLGSLALKADDPGAAAKYFAEFVAIDPKSVEGNRRLASAHLTAGDYAAAAGVYERLTELDGPAPEYLLALGLIYDQLDRVGDALQAYELALENAPEKDREVVVEALGEFKERRSIGDLQDEAGARAPVEIPHGPLPDEEDMPEAPPTEGLGETDMDLSGEGFEPKVIGDVELADVVRGEVPVEGFTTVEAPPEAPAPEGPPAAGPAEEGAPGPKAGAPLEEAQEPEGAPLGAEAPAEAAREQRAPAVASTEVQPLEGLELEEPPAPEEPGGPVDEPESEELAAALEAATSGWAEPEDDVPAEEVAEADEEPAVAPQAPERPAPAPLPVVSAPPRAREPLPVYPEEPSEELTRELEALSGALESGGEVTDEGEPFRRPDFDVDRFMADLEAKTAATFEHLYDGMLEARRKEAEEGAEAEEAPTTPYVSAPPIEGLPGMAVGQQAPVPSAADDRTLAPAHSFAPYAEGAVPPPIPLLLREQADRETARPRQAAGPKEPAKAPRPSAPPPTDQLDRARALLDSGDDAGALRLVDEHLASYPDDARAWNLRGDLRERAADEEDALDCYRNAVKYDPRLKEAWNNLGVLLHLLGRFADAADALESGTHVDENDRHLWHNLGSTYHELGRLEDAIKAFDRAVHVDPHDKVSHNNRGTTLFELADFEGARASFQRAIEIDPEFEQAQNNLGRALERLGQADEAAASYRRALKLNPQSRTAAANLARVTGGRRGPRSPA